MLDGALGNLTTGCPLTHSRDEEWYRYLTSFPIQNYSFFYEMEGEKIQKDGKYWREKIRIGSYPYCSMFILCLKKK